VKRFLQSWLINTLAVLVAVYIVHGIHYQKPLDLFVASLLLGIFNAVLRPALLVLTLPMVIFSLGLFTLVINAALLYLVGWVLKPYFYVDTFWAAFWGATIISVISLILNTLTGTGRSRIQVSRRRSQPQRPNDGADGGNGPVIDV